MPLPDPCPVCGFSGSSLTPGDLEAVIGSLPRRWGSVLQDPEPASAGDPSAQDLAGMATAELLVAIGAVRGGTAAAEGRSTPMAAADALLAMLRALDEPWKRPGVGAAVTAAAHAATHHLREAERAVEAARAARGEGS